MEDYHMTIADLRRIVTKKFHIGQKVTLSIKDVEKYGGDKITVRILDFNPECVLTERKGIKESFRYWDFLKATLGITEEKTINERNAGRHNSTDTASAY
jgi:hypothetical protein